MSDVVLKEMPAGGRDFQRDFSSWEEPVLSTSVPEVS